MFVEFKLNTVKAQVRAYCLPVQNLVFQSSVAGFFLFFKTWFNLTCFVGVNRV